MVTTSRITFHRRLLGVTVTGVVLLLAPSAVSIPQAHADDGPSCATAALLVRQGLPRHALALLNTPGAPTCPDAESDATTAVTQSALDWVDADASLKAKKWAAAQASAEAALEKDRENDDADKVRIQASLELERATPRVTKPVTAKPAEDTKSWLEGLQDQWNDFVDRQLSPGSSLLLPFFAMLVCLVVLARLVVLAVRQWPPADELPLSDARPDDESQREHEHPAGDPDRSTGVVLPKQVVRPYILAGGLLSVGSASLLASVVTADAASHPLSRALTGVTLVLTLMAAGWVGWTARHSWQRATPESEQPTAPDGPTDSPDERRSLRRRLRRGVDGDGGTDSQRTHPWAQRTRWAITRLSIAAAVLAVAVLAIRLTAGNDLSDLLGPLTVLALATVLAVQGVWLLAWWLATRIRLDVKGPTGAAEVGTVAAVLYELGAEKPQGLEVPRGADVTALDGALGSLPENPVLKVLKDIIRSISGVTPWTATIEGDATARVVTVVRNGRTLGSAILDPQRLGLDDRDSSTADGASAGTKASVAAATVKSASPATADRTLQMAASFVLTTMAQEHPLIARGLAGSSSWRSLGYQYIGSTMRVVPSDTAARDLKLALLARALDEDGGNRAARLAFRHAIDRDSTDCQALDRYATFLVDFCTDLDDHVLDFDTTALRLRATYTRALMLVNAVYAHGKDGHDTESGTPCGLTVEKLTEQAQQALSRLLILVEIKDSASSPDPLKEFKTQFADDIKGTLLLARLSAEIPSPSSPIGMYNLGCAFASRHDVTWLPPTSATLEEQRATELTTERAADDLTALVWLQLASQDRENKEWMADDPQLVGFRARQTYRTAFLTEPRTDFFTLSTVTAFAPQLKTAGYGDVSLLAAATPRELSSLLSAAPGVCAQLTELARLHQGLSAFGESAEEDPLTKLLQALTEAPPPGGPGLLAALTDLVADLGAFFEGAATPPAATPVPLDRWAIEVLDELTSSGLARRDTLVALSADRQGTVAKKIAATLMKKHHPGAPKDTGNDLDDYEKRLSTAIAAWFRRPYEPTSTQRS